MLKISLKGKFNNISNILIILGISFLLIVIWFRTGMPITKAEPGLFMYNSEYWFDRTRYTWNEVSGGLYSPRAPSGIFFAGFMLFLERLGFPPVLKEATLFFTVLSLSGIGMYYLVSTIYKGENRRLVALLSSLFYMLNPFQLWVWNRFILQFVANPLYPLLLALYIKGLERRERWLSILLMAGLLSMLFSSGVSLMPLNVPVIMLSYFVFHTIRNARNKEALLNAIKFTALMLTTLFLLNAYWVLPPLLSPQAAGLTLSFDPVACSRYWPLHDVFRMITWNWDFSLLWPHYQSASFIAIGYSIPLVAFAALLLRHRDHYVIYFSILSIVGLFLSKGANPPFGELLAFVGANFPTVWILGTYFDRAGFLIALGYSYLFGLSIISLIGHIRLKMERQQASRINVTTRKILAVSLLLLICFTYLGFYSWPMWTGDVFSHPWVMSYYVDRPEYYSQAENWLEVEDSYFRILQLPLSPVGGNRYLWKHGYTGAAPTLLGPYDHWSGPFSPGQGILGSLQNYMMYNQIHKLMQMLGIKYIVVEYAVDHTLVGTIPPSEAEYWLQTTLDPKGGLTHVYPSDITQGWRVLIARPPYEVRVEGEGGEDFIVGEGQSDEGRFLVFYEIPGFRDWSSMKFLHLWLKSNVPGDLFIEVYDSVGNRTWWTGNWNKAYVLSPSQLNVWQYIVLPLSRPDGQTEGFEVSSINGVVIGVSGLHDSRTVSLCIKNVTVSSGQPVKVEGVKLTQTFGTLKFYHVENPNDRIYAADRFKVYPNLNLMLLEINDDEFDPHHSVALLADEMSPEVASLLEDPSIRSLSKPDVEYHMLNPTKYVVRVHNATTPYFLVLNTRFDHSWLAYIDGNEVPGIHHFEANGYSNSWYIAKSGSYDILIEFWPQKIVDYGFLVSLITLAALLILTLTSNLKPRKKP